jgi:hypothetical protein
MAMKKAFNIAARVAGASVCVASVSGFAASFFVCSGVNINQCKNPLPLLHTTPFIFLLGLVCAAGLSFMHRGTPMPEEEQEPEGTEEVEQEVISADEFPPSPPPGPPQP